ncbi:MAG: hypothetical protein ACM3NS_04725 [Deltaproteobacteria bacterium]
MRGWWSAGFAGFAAACLLSTSRPTFGPLLGAETAEVHLAPAAATQRLGEALLADSIPVTDMAPRDGYVQTPWFDAATGRPTRRSALGPEVVRVRGWVNPGRYGHSDLRVEVAYRALWDPAVPERELERPVPPDHPVRTRVQAALDTLARRFGG